MVCKPVRRDNRPTDAQTMLYLNCTIITSVDLAHYGVSRAKDWVSVDCGTIWVDSTMPSKDSDGMAKSIDYSVYLDPSVPVPRNVL